MGQQSGGRAGRTRRGRARQSDAVDSRAGTHGASGRARHRCVSRSPLQSGLLWITALLAPRLSTPAQAPLPEWKVGAVPLVTIGGDGTPQSEFFRIRTAWRLASGSIVVVDGSTNELRVFDARGTFLHSFGRKGAGPGEFQGMQWNAHFGDTAVVYDGNLRRITTISLAGAPRLLEEMPVRGEEERGFDIAGRLRDGRWVAHRLGLPDMRLAPGVQRLAGTAGLLAANAVGVVDWFPEQPDLSVIVYNPDASRKQVSVVVAPFASSLAVAASGSVIWLGNTASDSLVRFDALTAKRTTVRLPDPPVALTRSVIESARAREVASARSQSARDLVALKYAANHLPRNQPVFEDLIPGYGEELWVQRFTDEPSAPGRYVVVAGHGMPMARVSVAPGFRLTDVGRDYIVGIHRDTDGVEAVRVYALSR